MAKPTAKSPSRPDTAPPAGLQQLRIGAELADTTWRITVPVVLFAGLGIVIDRTTGSRPWMTLLGMAVGFFVAAYLIKKQLQRWPDMPVKPGSYERNRKPGDSENKDYYSD